MRNLLTYLVWTFISSALLKSGIDVVFDKSIGYLPAITLTVFFHVTVVFPIIISTNALFLKNENR